MTDRYWVLGEAALNEMLNRAKDGDDATVLIAELYANSEVEKVPRAESDERLKILREDEERDALRVSNADWRAAWDEMRDHAARYREALERIACVSGTGVDECCIARAALTGETEPEDKPSDWLPRGYHEETEPDNYVGSAGAEHVTKYDPQWAVQPKEQE